MYVVEKHSEVASLKNFTSHPTEIFGTIKVAEIFHRCHGVTDFSDLPPIRWEQKYFGETRKL